MIRVQPLEGGVRVESAQPGMLGVRLGSLVLLAAALAALDHFGGTTTLACDPRPDVCRVESAGLITAGTPGPPFPLSQVQRAEVERRGQPKRGFEYRVVLHLRSGQSLALGEPTSGEWPKARAAAAINAALEAAPPTPWAVVQREVLRVGPLFALGIGLLALVWLGVSWPYHSTLLRTGDAIEVVGGRWPFSRRTRLLRAKVSGVAVQALGLTALSRVPVAGQFAEVLSAVPFSRLVLETEAGPIALSEWLLPEVFDGLAEQVREALDLPARRPLPRYGQPSSS